MTSRVEPGGSHRRRADGEYSTASLGLTNARTRIVGDRTGVLADGFVTVIRLLSAARAAFGRAAERIGSAVTPLGWTIAVAAPLAVAAGYLFGWDELVVVGVAGLVLMAAAAANLVGRPGIAVELSMPHSRVVVGDAASGRVTAVNTTGHRVLGQTVEVAVGSALVTVPVPGLARGARHAQEFTVPTTRRGVLEIGPARTVRGDPIGLVRREVDWGGSAQLIVHPRTVAIASTSTGLIRDLEGSITRDLTTSDLSFHALREYVPGDERRNIHWKSTARTGRPMVRQFDQTRRSHIVVALSLADADYADDEEFELAVGVVGSLGARAIRDGREVSVIASGLTPEFAKRKVFSVRELATVSPARLLDDLAAVQHAGRALAIADVARVGAGRLQGASVAFLIVGSPPSPAVLRAASAHFPLGVETVAVVCSPDAVPGIGRLAGVTVITIGYLEDLKAALARSRARAS